MIDGWTKEYYDEAFAKLCEALKDVPAELAYAVSQVHGNWRLFARHITMYYTGCMQKRGSSHSEQNHSSITKKVGEYF